MKASKQSAIIFSVYQHVPAIVNAANHESTLNSLDKLNIPYKVVTGCYNGILEQSIVVHSKHESAVNTLCRLYKQESYLRQHPDGQCFLHFNDGRIEFVGELKPVPPEQVKQVKNWTYDSESDTYFVAV